MKITLLVLALMVLCESSYAQNCTISDPNANYTAYDTDLCTPIDDQVQRNCTLKKSCKVGYYSPIHGHDINCTSNTTNTNVSYWDPPDGDEEECTECESPAYGINCAETTKSTCSSACPYDAAVGCDSSKKTNDYVSCFLDEVHVTVAKTEVYGIIGAQSNVTIGAFLNLPATDVTVKAIFGTEPRDMEQINETYYKLDVAVEIEFMGDYKIEAVTKVDSYSNSANVTVNITDPVYITRVFDAQDVNETALPVPVKELLLKENDTIEWTCEASGIPIPEVRWYFEGAEVGNYAIGDKIYQVKDYGNMTSTLYIHPDVALSKRDSGAYACSATNKDPTGNAIFTETVALELVVLEGPVDEIDYATREDFLIAVIVLGIVLFLTIVAFAGFAIWIKKSGSELQSTQAKKYARPNDYTNTNPTFDDIQPEPHQAPAPADDVGSRMLNRPKPSLPKSKQKKFPQTQFEHGPPAPRTLASPPRQSVITQPKTTPTFQLPGNYVEPGRSTFPQYTSRPTSPSSPGLAQNDVNDIYDEPYNAPPQTPQRNAPIEEDVYEEPAGDQLYEETIEPPRRY